MNFELEYWP